MSGGPVTGGAGQRGGEAPPRRGPAPFAGILAAPLAWAGQLVVASQVEELACSPAPGDTGALGVGNTAAILVVCGLALALALAGGLAARRSLAEADGHRGRFRDTSRFLAFAGLALTAVFTVLILLGTVQAIALDPCAPS